MPSTFRMLLEQALDLDPSAREAWIENCCGEDATMAARLRECVRLDAQPHALLDAELNALVCRLGLAPRDGSERLGSLIGAYRLTDVIGRGGMGIVYRAERTASDFSQVVALKLVRDERVSSQTQLRFVRERSVLARLHHENIAHLIDGGIDAQNQPWFALEFIEGEPLLTWCDRRRLGIAERLRLILAICSAIEYAHGRLVVHRDIKPGNVMVSNGGVVKVLDFGIAKLLEYGADTSLATDLNTRLLTPEYAAPEQILGEDVSTATDVHALGLLIYEVLCGQRAFDSRGSAFEIQRDVVDNDPESMVSRLRSLEGTAPGTLSRAAGLRGVEPGKMLRFLRGDIHQVVAKAMRKEPDQRYSMVSALALDIERCLEGRPVAAAGLGRIYRARKFVVRNALPLGLAGFAAIALLSGAIGILWQNQRIREEVRSATAARDFLVDVFNSANPSQGGGKAPTAVDLVDAAVQRAEIELRDEPHLQAFLLNALGTSYATLGHRSEAIRILREADQAAIKIGGESSSQAQEIGLALVQTMVGEQSVDPQAVILANQIVTAQYRLPVPERKLIVRALLAQGFIRFLQGDSAAAVEAINNALIEVDRLRGPQQATEREWSMESLGYVLGAARRDLVAIGLYRDVLRSRSERQGSSLSIARTQSALALPLMRAGYPGDAEGLLREATDTYRGSVGVRGADYSEMLIRQGSVFVQLNKLDAARTAIEEALHSAKSLSGEHSVSYAAALVASSQLDCAAGDLEKAQISAQSAVAITSDLKGPDSRYVSAASHALGVVLFHRGAFAEAGRIFTAETQAQAKENSVVNVRTLDYLGRLQRLTDDPGEARRLHRRVEALATAHSGDTSVDALRARMSLAEDERDLGNVDVARTLTLANLQQLRMIFAEGHPWILESRLLVAETAISADPSAPCSMEGTSLPSNAGHFSSRALGPKRLEYELVSLVCAQKKTVKSAAAIKAKANELAASTSADRFAKHLAAQFR